MGGCNVVPTEHGRYSLTCMHKLRAVLDLYGVLGVLSYDVKMLLLLNMADMDCLLCGRLWSDQ